MTGFGFGIGWLLLALAILLEVAGTTCLKLSDGLARPAYTVATFLLYVATFTALGLSLKTIDLGIAYAIWAGLGTALVVVIGRAGFGEPLGAPKLAAIALIVVGVVWLQLLDHKPNAARAAQQNPNPNPNPNAEPETPHAPHPDIPRPQGPPSSVFNKPGGLPPGTTIRSPGST